MFTRKIFRLFHCTKSVGSNQELAVIARHDHFHTFGQVDHTGDVGGTEVELRTIVVEEGGVTATLVLGQDVHLAGELGVGVDGAGWWKSNIYT